MGKAFAILVFFGAVFGGGYYFGKVRSDVAKCTFSKANYPAISRPFVVAIVGRNNGAFLEKTVSSVLSQNYENFRIVYVDDGSDDGSLDLAKDLIGGSKRRVEIVVNEVPLGVLASLSNLVADCKDEEIVVVLEGEDWLAHEWVLSTLNQYYANSDLWITYGQSCEYPRYSLNEVKRPGRDRSFGKLQLSSFYAGLFRQIGHDAFADLRGGTDIAYMLPMLEMAGCHSTFIPEVLYIVNGSVPKEDGEIREAEKIVRSMAAYEPIIRWGGQ